MMLLLMFIHILFLNVLCVNKVVPKIGKDVKINVRTTESAVRKTSLGKEKILNKPFGTVNVSSTVEPFLPDVYCRKFKTCTKCMQTTRYICDWCHNYGCTDMGNKLCPTAAKRITKLQRPDLCPRIEHDSRILIPYGVRTNLKMKLRASDPTLYDKEVKCQIKLKNRLTHLKALVIGELIYCYPTIFDGKSEERIKNGTLQIIWGGMEPLSNTIPITVYQCEKMGKDCESCINIPRDYGCGWCSTNKSCVIGDKCSEDIMRWTINRVTCNEKKLQYIYH